MAGEEESFRREAEEVLDRMTAETGGAALEAVVAELARVGLREQDVSTWLAASPRFGLAGDCVIRLGGSMATRGVAVLAVRGEPMTLEEIFAALAEDKSFRGFKGQMQGDPRVRRVGLKHYGLESWGGEEYTTVADEMEQEIERQGEPVELDELARTLAKNFGVSPSSVRMYANGARFSIDADGKVSAGGGEMPETKPLALTRGCFKLGGHWALRKVVDHDIERGSGSALPFGFAKELGLTPGASLQLESPNGPVRCSWTDHMATVGSLRRPALDLGARKGDYLFLVATGNGRIEFAHVGAAACRTCSGMERLALECGGQEETPEGIAAALAIETIVSGPPMLRIRRRLLERGENDLAELLPDEEEDLLDVLSDL